MCSTLAEIPFHNVDCSVVHRSSVASWIVGSFLCWSQLRIGGGWILPPWRLPPTHVQPHGSFLCARPPTPSQLVKRTLPCGSSRENTGSKVGGDQSALIFNRRPHPLAPQLYLLPSFSNITCLQAWETLRGSPRMERGGGTFHCQLSSGWMLPVKPVKSRIRVTCALHSVPHVGRHGVDQGVRKLNTAYVNGTQLHVQYTLTHANN